ncbi:crossover junction endodeoxyribonuclease RuvC [Paenibacillus ehimensis]|uniref:crossover junction endodeoxyribonuclease RuvC n=1 Tax=Paenibacillus ehimensis TaxID=79264 RepID=UPI000FD85EC6|nr:crossover junction endodeoxyribonuclease RuvC [Paenibacillus ehimensis]MEC0211868.1 crossover junction endodeoxyribonuclease RuvC [Paenibacillus ehimensis]
MRYVGIDPSTKTGFVALDESGKVVVQKELTGVGNFDPKRMTTLIDEVVAHVRPEDAICIEGFGFASQQAIQLGGIGWGLRMALFRRQTSYIEAAPSTVKKFATGKGNTKKENMIMPIYKRWGFENRSDNIRDAFVLAQIMRVVHGIRTGHIDMDDLPKYQIEAIKPMIKGAN